MRLGEYRIVYNAYYNHRAEHDVKEHPDVWIIEEQCRVTLFGLFTLWEYWSTHKEPQYDTMYDIRFPSAEEAFAYVERLLNGNPRNTYITTVVTEVDHERVN